MIRLGHVLIRNGLKDQDGNGSKSQKENWSKYRSRWTEPVWTQLTPFPSFTLFAYAFSYFDVSFRVENFKFTQDAVIF